MAKDYLTDWDYSWHLARMRMRQRRLRHRLGAVNSRQARAVGETAQGVLWHDFARDRHGIREGALINRKRVPLRDLWTFTRSSTVNGWTLDANGDPVLTEFATDAPAIVIDPATGQRLGYRALAGFTNSLLWSRDLSNGVWSGSATIAQDAVGLDGVANTAWTVTDDSTGSLESRRQDLTIADDTATHAAVFFVKKDSDESRFPELNLYLTGGTSQFQATQINTATGEITDRASSGTSKSESVGDFWKVTLTNTNNNSGNTNLRYVVAPAATTTLGTTEASATGSIVYDFGGVYLNYP